MSGLETLRDALDIALLRIESGQPLGKAVADAPRFRCETKWVERWVELRERLLRGDASSFEGLANFRRSVDLQLRIQRLVARRSLLPLVQAGAVGLTSLLFLIATQTLFADLFRMEISELALSVSLLGLGYVWIWKLLRSYKKDLWFIDWLEFISGLATSLSWGQGLLVAWKKTFSVHERLPVSLQKFLETSFEKAENYQPLSSAPTTPEADVLSARCRLRWEQVHRLFINNERVLPVLEREIENAFETFQDGLERKTEILSAKLMMPLFICFAPAYLVMLLAPLIRPFLASGSAGLP